MIQKPTPALRSLPHHKLVAYQVAVQLLLAVRAAGITDTELRNQAGRAARSVCLNTAEGAGRTSRADQNRSYGIARAETVEVAAAVEIAQLCEGIDATRAREIAILADRTYALLCGLMRR